MKRNEIMFIIDNDAYFCANFDTKEYFWLN